MRDVIGSVIYLMTLAMLEAGGHDFCVITPSSFKGITFFSRFAELYLISPFSASPPMRFIDFIDERQRGFAVMIFPHA